MRKSLAVWIPVLLVCAAIFLLSQDSLSDIHSNRILVAILGLFHAATAQRLAELAYPFRKFAHVVVYSILSLMTYRALRGAKHPGFYAPLAVRSVVFCLLYASSDEIHQIFVPGRGPALHDVLLDGLAAATAMLLLQAWYQFRRPPFTVLPETILEDSSM